MGGSEPTAGSGGVDDILAHFGKRGMKWGVRKSSPRLSNSPPGSVMLYTKPGKGIVKTEGGRNYPISEDAKRAASLKQIVKKSSLDALSNDQLQRLNKRMELTTKYKNAIKNDKQVSIGKKYALGFLKSEGIPFLKGSQGPWTKVVFGIKDGGKDKKDKKSD